MTDAPITLTLDLWAKGHSAGQIAEMLGHPSHKTVTRIVANARLIGDSRAVYHRLGWSLLGRGIPQRDRFVTPVQRSYAGFRIVPLASVDPAKPRRDPPPLKHCRRGHILTPDNVVDGNRCRVCKRINRAATYQRHGK